MRARAHYLVYPRQFAWPSSPQAAFIKRNSAKGGIVPGCIPFRNRSGIAMSLAVLTYRATDVNASNYLLRARSTNSESRLTICLSVLPANHAVDGIARSPFQIADFVSTIVLALAFVDEVGWVIEMGGLIVIVSGGAGVYITSAVWLPFSMARKIGTIRHYC